MGLSVWSQVDMNKYFSISNINKEKMQKLGVNMSIKQLRAKARKTAPFMEVLTGQSDDKGYKRKTKIYRYEDFKSAKNNTEVKTVFIPACAEHMGLNGVNIKLYWRCPVCGGFRGEIRQVKSYDGSLVLFCNGWTNPCGHIDKYVNLLQEAKENGLNGGAKCME